MDPLSILASTAIVIEIVHKSVLIINAVRSIHETVEDPKFIAAQADLFLEKQRLALWTQYVKNQPGGWEAVTAHMSPDLVNILRRFQEQSDSLLEKAKHLSDMGDPREKHGTERMKASVFWATRGKDLATVLNAIHKVNNALEKIIEPPPGYYGSLPAPYSSQSRSVPGITAPSARENRSEDAVGSTTVQEHSTSSQPPFRTIHHLFRYSVAALENIENYGRKRANTDLSTSLRRWADVLDEPMALDILLSVEAQGELAYAELKQMIITVFVDIILIEESILANLVVDRARPDLDQTLVELVASLAASEATEIAVNRAARVYEYSGIEELVAKGMSDIDQGIEDLYDLLPPILMLRRGAQLEATKKSKRLPERIGETEQLLQAVQDMVQSSGNAEFEKTSGSSKSRPWAKELERLRDYRQNQAVQLRGVDRTLVNEILRKFIQDHRRDDAQSQLQRVSSSGGFSKEHDTKFGQRISELIGNLPRPGNALTEDSED
ncbi:hypothetical protein F5Y19DRAFT_372189 [Xylariaceae sp. FL1651]|nr:hypothetical protein F5Y19DRAFT_372189 [Xylariaceae sp. FL1651]